MSPSNRGEEVSLAKQQNRDQGFWAPSPPLLHHTNIENFRPEQASDILPLSPRASSLAITDRSDCPNALSNESRNSLSFWRSPHESGSDQRPKQGNREKSKKLVSGLLRFFKTPLGVAVGIYGVLVVFWGAALVLILSGIYPMPNKRQQNLWVEYSSSVGVSSFPKELQTVDVPTTVRS